MNLDASKLVTQSTSEDFESLKLFSAGTSGPTAEQRLNAMTDWVKKLDEDSKNANDTKSFGKVVPILGDIFHFFVNLATNMDGKADAKVASDKGAINNIQEEWNKLVADFEAHLAQYLAQFAQQLNTIAAQAPNTTAKVTKTATGTDDSAGNKDAAAGADLTAADPNAEGTATAQRTTDAAKRLAVAIKQAMDNRDMSDADHSLQLVPNHILPVFVANPKPNDRLVGGQPGPAPGSGIPIKEPTPV